MTKTQLCLAIMLIFSGYFPAVMASEIPADNPPSAPSCLLHGSWEPWAPYTYEKNGTLTGIDVEISEFVASEMGCTIKWHKLIWKRALQLLQIGHLSFVSGASITEDRKQWGIYTETPYRTETMSLFMRKNEIQKYSFKSLDELFQSDQFTLGVTLDYSYGETFDNMFKQYKKQSIIGDSKKRQYPIKIIESNLDSKNYVKLTGRSHEITGFIGSKMQTIYDLNEKNLSKAIAIHPLTINESNVFFLFSKENLKKQPNGKKIVETFDAIIKKHYSGKISDIIKKHLNMKQNLSVPDTQKP